MPAFVGTGTVAITPVTTETNNDNDDDDDDAGCSVRWTDAFVSTGVRGKILAALFYPCLVRGFKAHAQEEWQYCYEEARRRTTEKADVAANDDGTTQKEAEPATL